MIIIPKPAIPEFIKTDKVISLTQLFEKFKASDARGLGSLQALAELALFLGGDIIITTEAATEALTEFLHNMSYQALNNENDNILLEFDWLTELKIEIIKWCLDENLGSLKINQKKEEKIEQELNDYQFAFDLFLAEKIQSEVDEIMTSISKPEIKPDFEPKPLLATDQIFNETTKQNEEFIKKSEMKK